MEKSIEFGFEHYIHMIPGVREIRCKELFSACTCLYRGLCL